MKTKVVKYPKISVALFLLFAFTGDIAAALFLLAVGDISPLFFIGF